MKINIKWFKSAGWFLLPTIFITNFLSYDDFYKYLIIEICFLKLAITIEIKI